MDKVKIHLEKDPIMALQIEKFPNILKEWEDNLDEKRDLFTSITRTIVGQQLSVKAARTIWERFEKLVGKVTPDNILKHQEQEFRDAGMSWAKVSYVISLANDVKSKKINLEEIRDLSDGEVLKKLVELKGIGPWSAEMILMFTLKRADVFSIGDMGLRNAVSKLYGVDKNNFDEILKISSAWSPYRTVACMFLWESLDNV